MQYLIWLGFTAIGFMYCLWSLSQIIITAKVTIPATKAAATMGWFKGPLEAEIAAKRSRMPVYINAVIGIAAVVCLFWFTDIPRVIAFSWGALLALLMMRNNFGMTPLNMIDYFSGVSPYLNLERFDFLEGYDYVPYYYADVIDAIAKYKLPKLDIDTIATFLFLTDIIKGYSPDIPLKESTPLSEKNPTVRPKASKIILGTRKTNRQDVDI